MTWLEDKTAIVTGSTRGIGLEIARLLLRQGMNVVVFCRHKEHGKQAEQDLRKDGEVHIMHGDVRKMDDVKRIVQETIELFGGIDVLVNNAGTAIYKETEYTSEQEFDDVLDTNLKGSFLFIHEVLPIMKRNGQGRIINIASGLGLKGKAKYSGYCPLKFGLIGLTQVVADETQKTGVVCVAIAPGAVATKLHFDVHPWENAKKMMTPQYIAESIFKKTLSDKLPKNGALFEIYR
ncbi:MAG: SDR family oxidoreductase [Patescibacteria group bacterium]